VGSWRIDKVKPVTGASNIDGVSLIYKKLNRTLTVLVIVFPTTSSANSWVDNLKTATSKIYRKKGITPKPTPVKITIKNDDTARTKGFRFKNRPETLIYHVDKTGTMMVGDRGDVVEFFKAFPM
jgi:hypothetical protein